MKQNHLTIGKIPGRQVADSMLRKLMLGETERSRRPWKRSAVDQDDLRCYEDGKEMSTRAAQTKVHLSRILEAR